MNDLTKRKIRLSITLMTNLIVAYIISMIVYFIVALFLENGISLAVESLNYELYSWIVNNRNIVIYIYWYCYGGCYLSLYFKICKWYARSI